MNKIFKFAALLSVCLMAFAGCAPEEISTDQFSDDAVTFAAFAPNPVARGGALRITGSNLQKVNEVVLPGVDPITEIEVVKEGKYSEIRVIVPVDGPEVGPVSIVADGKTFTSLVDLTYSEPIIFDGFSPAEAMPGDVITIKGDYMNNIKAVQFEGGASVVEFSAQSRYEMKVVVPATAVTGKIILCDVDENNNPDGLVANMFYSEDELVIGDPMIKKADRGELKSGAEVTVSGEYLNMIASVNFGGVDADFTVAEDGKSLKTVLPATSVDGDLVLVSYAGKEFVAGAYTTKVPSGLSIAAETRYKAGLKAVVTGKDLDLVTAAALNGTGLEYVVSDNKLSFTIPAAATDGTVVLTLANGKTVETEAVTLVKPVITAVSPLELYAGDEPVVVSGEDLDLVSKATLGGVEETIEVAEDGKSIKVGTTVSSVSGKVVLSLPNGVTVESEESVTVNYHSLVIVTEMPAAQNIGAEVVLKGSKFDLVENIFIGDVKVTQYILRTPEEIRFYMPWNKVGSYKMSFQLFNGDVEVLATPIEVLLELKVQTIWEGREDSQNYGANLELGPDDNAAWIGAGVAVGDEVRIYFDCLNAADWQVQVFDAHWSAITLPWGSNQFNASNSNISGGYVKFAVTDAIYAQLTSQQYWGKSIILQGQHAVFTKIELVREISQEVTVWEGNVDLGAWTVNYEVKPNDMFVTNPISAGQKLRFYVTPTSDWWQMQLFNGHWGGMVLPESAAGNNNLNAGSNTITPEGYIEVTVTDLMVEELTTMIDWGYAMIIQGESLIVTKIAFM